VYYNNTRLLHHISRNTCRSFTEAWIIKEHRRVFTTWLMDKDIHTEDMTMKMLSSHPSGCVTSWQAYDINGYTYYTKKETRIVLPKIVAFTSRLLIHKD
jgi:hypothetical protein